MLERQDFMAEKVTRLRYFEYKYRERVVAYVPRADDFDQF